MLSRYCRRHPDVLEADAKSLSDTTFNKGIPELAMEYLREGGSRYFRRYSRQRFYILAERVAQPQDGLINEPAVLFLRKQGG